MSDLLFDRRQFVQTLAGGALLSCLPAIADAAVSSGSAPFKGVVGVLLPGGGETRGQLQVARDYWQGLQAGGSLGLADIQWIPVYYGQAGSHAERAAIELLAQHRVHALAGFLDGNAAASLAPLLQERGVPMLVADAGASVLQPLPGADMVFRHSLGYWQSSWSAGRWAASALGRKAAVAVGPLESGYDMLPAFTRGFESAGGRVLMTGFTHHANGQSRIAEVQESAMASGADFVFALDSGSRAQALISHWQDSQAHLHLPMLAGGEMAEQLLAHKARAVPGMWAVSSWQDARGTAATSSFPARAAGAIPSHSRMSPVQRLGYESAQALAMALRAAFSATTPVAQALADARWGHPQGDLGFSLQREAPVFSYVVDAERRTAPVALPAAQISVCDGLCSALASRCTNTYLVA